LIRAGAIEESESRRPSISRAAQLLFGLAEGGNSAACKQHYGENDGSSAIHQRHVRSDRGITGENEGTRTSTTIPPNQLRQIPRVQSPSSAKCR